MVSITGIVHDTILRHCTCVGRRQRSAHTYRVRQCPFYQSIHACSYYGYTIRDRYIDDGASNSAGDANADAIDDAVPHADGDTHTDFDAGIHQHANADGDRYQHPFTYGRP